MLRLIAMLTTCFVASSAQAAPLSWTQTTNWVLWQYGGIVFATLLVLFAILHKRGSPAVDEIVVPSVPATPMFEETLLTTLFHTARLNGEISQTAMQALLRSYKNLTGKSVSQNMITAKYAHQAETADLLSIMAPFSRIERDTMMRGCVDVAVANGEIGPRENDFLLELKTALDLDSTVLHNQIRAALRPDVTVPPRQFLAA